MAWMGGRWPSGARDLPTGPPDLHDEDYPQIDGGLPEPDLERSAGVHQAVTCAGFVWFPIIFILVPVFISTRSLAGVSWLIALGLVLAAVFLTVGFLSDRLKARQRRNEDSG